MKGSRKSSSKDSLVINVIPPEDEESGSSKPKRGTPSIFYNSGETLGNDKSLNSENIFSTDIFSNYYDQKVFKPYYILMMILGWKPCVKHRIIYMEPKIFQRIANAAYPILIAIFYLAGLTLKIFRCRDSELNHHPKYKEYGCWYSHLNSSNSLNGSNISQNVHHSDASYYIMSFFHSILPDALTFALLLDGYYLFRFKDWEFIHTLMETTFLKILPPLAEEVVESDPTSFIVKSMRRKQKASNMNENTKRIRALKDFDKIYKFMIFWLTILTLLLIVKGSLTVLNLTMDQNLSKENRISEWIIVGVLIANVILSSLVIAVILCTYLLLLQSLEFLLRDIKEKILTRQLDLDIAKRELFRVKTWIDTLNNDYAIPLFLFSTICLIYILQRFQSNPYEGIATENDDKIRDRLNFNSSSDWVKNTDLKDTSKYDIAHKGVEIEIIHRVLTKLNTLLTTILYTSSIFFTFTKAVKISTIGKLNDYIGLEVSSKPYGFQNVPHSIIDSFLTFTTALKLKPQICCMAPRTCICGIIIVVVVEFIYTYLA
ncbi:unnamed protein product [Gordionus sp. m RMFG-2023]